MGLGLKLGLGVRARARVRVRVGVRVRAAAAALGWREEHTQLQPWVRRTLRLRLGLRPRLWAGVRG